MEVQIQVSSAIPTRFVAVPDGEAKPRSLKVDGKQYSGKERGNITLWVGGIEMAMNLA